ncbi:MAG: hypothetical protein II663_01475, partial [Bacteroidales bacterium]|nr:hypothetical protein [Bacteroidales bacterium]
MNVSNYRTIRRIKWLFFTIAVVILIVGFVFFNTTINDIRKEERVKVMLWADAVQQRNSLLEYATKLFDKLKDEELQKVELWRESQQLIMEVEDSQFLTFLLSIITTNKNIPIILTDADKNVITTMNLNENLSVNKPIPPNIS